MKKTNIRGILELAVILIVILSAVLVLIPNNCDVETNNNTTNNINSDNHNDFLINNNNNQDQGLIQELEEHTESFCKNLCGNGVCDEMVNLDVDSTCYETAQTCPIDC